MNDGGDGKITRQGGYCYLREQMIVKKGKKKELIVKAKGVRWAVELVDGRSTFTSS